MQSFIKRAASLYCDGLRSMVLGRTLWTIILLKLIVLFFLSQVFFPDYLHTHFSTDDQRSVHVISNLTGRTSSNN
jgi:hypothetical protein